MLIAHHDPELMMSKMMHSVNLPFMLLFDRREPPTAVGTGEGQLQAFVRPGLYLQLAREVTRVLLGSRRRSGERRTRRRLGGDFVVDRDGTLVFANRLRSFHDRAKIEDLLAVVKSH